MLQWEILNSGKWLLRHRSRRPGWDGVIGESKSRPKNTNNIVVYNYIRLIKLAFSYPFQISLARNTDIVLVVLTKSRYKVNL